MLNVTVSEDPLVASSSDEEEESSVPVTSIPLPEEAVAEALEKKRKEDAERQRKRLLHVRPWDKEKKIS